MYLVVAAISDEYVEMVVSYAPANVRLFVIVCVEPPAKIMLCGLVKFVIS